MTDESFKRGVELVKLIDVTRNGLLAIEKMINSSSECRLSISEFSDGSGINARLSRSEGNLKLLDVVTTELRRQIRELEDEFSKL